MKLENLIRLDDICMQVFNLSPQWARRKASEGKLGIPAFRLSVTSRGPFFIRQEDLDKYIETRVNNALKIARLQ